MLGVKTPLNQPKRLMCPGGTATSGEDSAEVPAEGAGRVCEDSATTADLNSQRGQQEPEKGAGKKGSDISALAVLSWACCGGPCSLAPTIEREILELVRISGVIFGQVW